VVTADSGMQMRQLLTHGTQRDSKGRQDMKTGMLGLPCAFNRGQELLFFLF
jgi:hypothetical protein